MEFYGIDMQGEYWMEEVSSVPTNCTADDERRLIYVKNDECIYFASWNSSTSTYVWKKSGFEAPSNGNIGEILCIGEGGELEWTNNYIKTNNDSEPTVDNTYIIGSPSKRFKNIYSTEFTGIASSSRYADLAEKYTIKDEVEIGDVILISEENNYDGELSNQKFSDRILGVVSEKPGFLMNNDLKNGIKIALKGRIPCKVQGPIKKGSPLMSGLNGTAISGRGKNITLGALLGKANETIEDNSIKLIEIII